MDDVTFSGEQQVSAFLARAGKLLIDGKHVPAVSGATFDVINPATEQVIARVAHGDKADVDLAVSAARKAFDGGPWVRMAPAERAKLIYKLGEAIDRHADELALIETLDNGKPLKAARTIDIPSSAEKLRYYAGWATKLYGTTADVSLPGDWHAYTLREPVGVAALIVPWNFPLMMAVSKIAPALAAGCTVILKPAEQTPLTALRLGELVQEIGFPPGVINIVTGFGEAGAALVDHPGVDKVSFTGSTEVGKLILKAATGNLKRVTLELGGKSPVIVFPDANIDQTIEGVSRFIFSNAGQVCAAGSRLYAHKKVFDRILEGVAERAQKLRVGPGIDATTDMGPLVSQEQLDRVTGFLQSGRDAGASVVTGGQRFGQSGYFVEPTILADTTADMAVRREEIFGPVLCASAFDDDSLDAIATEANNTTYGLSAYVWTQNVGVAHKMAKRLKAGFIRINGGGLDNALPFGGYKQSGWGRENAQEGVETFTEVKSVIIGL
ncbi:MULTISPECIES: aldehyde dehydrogenase family protein [unclassified Beijerinckia]|uniref:aldehyde dehydrogenase family protein n=1 Tax=unclassified Beijerinckia TaxID=2638183 RepID=UPI00089C2936|nr:MULTISPECIES: aldehyde dehydrogenase family protein [unclassified Beijerinckia]MDH7797408.1 phenylacetaldehyde dehydrogenase [Beijerinckia sp. GAS462]SEC84299.1 phenylacetaldehyde dehydrogenase [Beijerinckia sp. 28-YEA-48]